MTEGKETAASAIDEERAEIKLSKETSISGNSGYKTSENQNETGMESETKSESDDELGTQEVEKSLQFLIYIGKMQTVKL